MLVIGHCIRLQPMLAMRSFLWKGQTTLLRKLSLKIAQKQSQRMMTTYMMKTIYPEEQQPSVEEVGLVMQTVVVWIINNEECARLVVVAVTIVVVGKNVTIVPRQNEQQQT